MSLPPLSHHDILRLAEPLVRQGWQVDLPASDRPARQLAFRARQRPAPAGGAWTETLHLDCTHATRQVLQRTLTPAAGPAATLRASGDDTTELLARLSAVAPAQQFSAGPGWVVARSYDTDRPGPASARAAQATAGAPALVLQQAELHAGGLVLVLTNRLPDLRSVAADLHLRPAAATGSPGDALARPGLPEDLLAVLGWDWARLVPKGPGWTSKLRLRGPVLRRSRTAEALLDRAGPHLARVLAGPPARFHDEHRLARWGVVLRRGIPSIMAVLMVVGALLLPHVADPEHSGLWMALHYLPIGLLAVAFSLQELARFEIPPLPRRLAATQWPGLAAPPATAEPTAPVGHTAAPAPAPAALRAPG